MSVATDDYFMDMWAVQRSRIVLAMFGGLMFQSLFSWDQRALFLPWVDAEHPMVVTTPQAFFAAVPPINTGGRRPLSLTRLARNGLRFTPPGQTPGGAVGEGPVPTTDTVIPDLPAVTSSALNDAGGGSPGVANSGVGNGDLGSVGAPVSQVGSVPEASTWAMLLIGFGLIGHAIRQRSRLSRASAGSRRSAPDLAATASPGPSAKRPAHRR